MNFVFFGFVQFVSEKYLIFCLSVSKKGVLCPNIANENDVKSILRVNKKTFV